MLGAVAPAVCGIMVGLRGLGKVSLKAVEETWLDFLELELSHQRSPAASVVRHGPLLLRLLSQRLWEALTPLSPLCREGSQIYVLSPDFSPK